MIPYIILHRLERGGHSIGIDAAALPDRTAAAALAAGDLPEGLDQVVGREPIGQGTRNLDGEIPSADYDRNAIAVRPAERVIGEHQQVLFAGVDPLEPQSDAVHAGFFELGATTGRQPLAEAGRLLLQAFDFGLQPSHPRRQSCRSHSELFAEFGEHPLVLANLSLRGGTGPYLDPPHPGTDASIARDQGEPDLAASFDVRPAA
jgi:hypothetical protein